VILEMARSGCGCPHGLLLGDEAGVAELLHHHVEGAPVVLDVAVLAVLLAPSPRLVRVHGFGERCAWTISSSRKTRSWLTR
jgi:hypothetical protein